MNMLKQFREMLYKTIIFILTVILAAVLFLRTDRNQTEYLNYNVYEILHLYNQMKIEQAFQPAENYLKSISLYFANIEEDMGILEMEIRNEDRELVYQKEIDADTLETGTFNSIPVNQSVKRGETYILSLVFRGNEEEDNFIGLMAVPGEKNLSQTGECYFDGLEAGYNLAMSYDLTSRPPQTGMTLFFAFIVLLNVFLIPCIRKMKMVQDLKKYLILFWEKQVWDRIRRKAVRSEE